MKIIVCGKNGQLAKAFKSIIKNDEVVFYSHNDFDFLNLSEIEENLNDKNADLIINTMAYTNVELAEDEQEQAYGANAVIPENLAKFCKNNNIPLVHFSTDYVYSGSGDSPQNENSLTEPLNIYGKSKLKGETNISNINCKHLIFRTSWLFDYESKNFLNTMISLAKTKEELEIINDQIGAPTNVEHLAKSSLECAKKAIEQETFPSGIYNICNSGFVSWHDYVLNIFEFLRENNIQLALKNVKAVPSTEYKTKAERPLNSRLDCSKLEKTFNVKMPSWQDAVRNAMEKQNESN